MLSQTLEEKQSSAAAYAEDGSSNYNCTVMYLAYGNVSYIQETVFSLLTAAYFEPFESGRIRYVVYTDQPAMSAKRVGAGQMSEDAEIGSV